MVVCKNRYHPKTQQFKKKNLCYRYYHSTTNGYPLQLRANVILIENTPIDSNMVRSMLSKINYHVLAKTYNQLRADCCGATGTIANNEEATKSTTAIPTSSNGQITVMVTNNDGKDTTTTTAIDEIEQLLPPFLPEIQIKEEEDDPKQLQLHHEQLYRIMFDIHIQEGTLTCPDSGRVFFIKDGIPNMILHEDEL